MTVENNHRWPAPNHNYVPEFQMSGIPYVITKELDRTNAPGNGTTINIVANNYLFEFDQVTRWIVISNHNHQDNNHIRIYFNEDALKTANLNTNIQDPHYYRLDGNGDQTKRLELKCKKIWIYPENDDTSVSVIAGLTNVPSNTFPDQTKLNGFTGVQS